MVAASSLLWGSSGVFVRQLNQAGISARSVVIIKSCAIFLLLLLIILFTDRTLFRIRIKDLPLFMASGIMSVVLYNYFYCESLAVNPLSVTQILSNTAPIFTIILSVLIFHEKMTGKKTAAVLCCVVGCTLISGLFDQHGRITAYGFLTGLGSGLCYGVYGILIKEIYRKKYGLLTTLFHTFLTAAIVSVIVFYPYIPAVSVFKPAVAVSALTLVVFTLGGSLLYTNALNYIDVGKAAIITYLEPAFAGMLGIILYQESITVSLAAGIAMILAGVYFAAAA